MVVGEEDPEGEGAVLDDRLSAAAGIPDPPDRVAAGERAIQGRGKPRRRGEESGRLVGGVGARWKEEGASKGGWVVGMRERSSTNPRRMQLEERCRRSIQSPTFIHRHSWYSRMRKKESVFLDTTTRS